MAPCPNQATLQRVFDEGSSVPPCVREREPVGRGDDELSSLGVQHLQNSIHKKVIMGATREAMPQVERGAPQGKGMRRMHQGADIPTNMPLSPSSPLSSGTGEASTIESSIAFSGADGTQHHSTFSQFTGPVSAPTPLAQQSPAAGIPNEIDLTEVPLHGDQTVTVDLTADSVDPIRDRWMNPLLDINAPSSKLAGHSMEFLFRVLRTYPRMLVQDEDVGCPIIHPCQLLPDKVRLPMANCIVITRMWDGHSQQSAGIIESTIDQEMQRLVDEYINYEEEDLLAAMQSLLIHMKMMKLHEVAHILAKTGLTLAEEEPKAAPEWEDWIRITTKTRTILAFFCFEWAFSAYNNLLSYHCHEIGFILAPTSKLLWLATTKEEWERRYSRWMLRWRPRGFFRMEELMAIPPGVQVDERVNAWLAETDEFGIMIMAMVGNMLLQVIRLTLRPSLTISAPAFLGLRKHVSEAGAVSQHYGYMLSTKSLSLSKKRHEICWIIQWPGSTDLSVKPSLIEELNDVDGNATSVLYNFEDSQLEELSKAIEAPICEFAYIRLVDDAPMSDISFKTSMHKTYTDTYKLLGFTGGHWAYSLNSNSPTGVPLARTEHLEVGERRLAAYLLGWESVELHQDASATEIFAEEIDKLMPYFGPGSGAWYVSFRKHE
ncbi:hypothetical protein PT974_12498 [Cladobotryum mycophilum]|uniref:Uncharacterized protein n=1 Tax=Cladobotryum mycophilum TaxID=491253 RepID=A0ABR0S844_9HYPO